MFNGLDFTKLGGLMQNMQQIQEKFQQVQAELSSMTATGKGGMGAVLVTVNGHFEVITVDIKEELLQEVDHHIIADYVKAGTNQAIEKIKEMKEQKMNDVMGGMPIPPQIRQMFFGS